MNDFCHLHVHDQYSLLDGFGSPDDFASAAAAAGQKHLAITNHGNIDSALKVQKACKANGIIPIFGCELYVVENMSVKERGEKRSHLTALVRNATGWKNLLRMLTIAHGPGFYYRPRVDVTTIQQHCEGLLFMTACASSVVNHKWGINLLREVSSAGCPVMAEIMPHDYDMQREINTIAIKLANRYGWPLVATNDCHYPREQDAVLQEIELAIQSKKKWHDPERWKFSVTGLYVKTRDEMKHALIEHGLDRGVISESLNNTAHVALLCEGFTSIEQKETRLPTPPDIKDTDHNRALLDMCATALAEKFPHMPEYADRMQEELELIFKQGFSPYFLIVEELVRWCRNNDVMVGPGRGSAGGSLVCHLLGITMVDPIKYGLLFARFISPSRIDIPDIDLDFEDRKRHLVFKHLSDLYGSTCVAGVSTYSTLGGKGVIRDVSRVFDVPMFDVNNVCKAVATKLIGDADHDEAAAEAFTETEEGKKFAEKYPLVADYASRMEGTVRGRGQHAAGVIVSADNLFESDKCYMLKGKDDKPVVNWDKKEIEAMGLMKLDVLGLNALTILSEVLELIRANHGVKIDLNKITLDDEKVFDSFTRGNSVGCFQFGSNGFRKFCGEFVIDDFDSIVHATSLWRPGPLQSGQAYEVIEFKHKRKRIPKRHPILKAITRTTYGVLLYQEQIMQVVNQLAGLPWETADEVRKLIAKSQGAEKLQAYRDAFVGGCVKRATLDESQASMIWENIVSFGKYGFNLSHAVEYSVISYWDMFFKVNYPQEFFVASLTYCAEDKKDDLIQDAMKNGIQVRPPKIGISNFEKWVAKDGVIYCPFCEIKGIGPATAQALKSNGIETRDDVQKYLPRFAKIFEACRCYDDETLTDEFAEGIEQYFTFSFCRNAVVKFKRLEKIVQSQYDYDSMVSGMTNMNGVYFGLVEEAKHKNDGVMASVRDMTGSNTFFFSNVRESKKAQSEKLVDKIMIARGYRSERGFVSCSDFWEDEDIVAANLKHLQINFAQDGTIVVLTETARKHHDRGFELLEAQLRKNFKDLGSEYFDIKYANLTNAKEIIDDANEKPIIVFALGAKPLQYLTSEKLAIGDVTGTTCWDKNRQCWISFSISQASTHYNAETSVPLFKQAVDNFCNSLKNISGLR